MAARRTQIYLSEEQRRKLDSLSRREHKPLAQVIRDAVDAYTGTADDDLQKSLDETFGTMPDLEVPSRAEWDRFL
jgi:hypothetical protein